MYVNLLGVKINNNHLEKLAHKRIIFLHKIHPLTTVYMY